MPPVHLLIKPSSGMCNMRCNYCFYHDITEKREQDSYGFMSVETLEQVIKKALAVAEGSATIAFQGGEPTLSGLPFFQLAVKLASQYNTKQIKVNFAIQTNGYHLGEEWASFFAREHFLVGISIDGTIHTHDAYRKNGGGNGTFLEVMKTVDLFEQYGVEYNILTVVNRRTAASIRKIYQYYGKMNFGYLQFIPCLDPIGAPAGKEEYSLTPEAYGQFLCDLFDLWYDDLLHHKEVYIRQFYNYASIMVTGRAEACDMNGYCSIQNVVEADGEVYPCDFFVLDEYKLGNLNTVSFEEIHQRRLEIGFLSPDKGPDAQCQACRYFTICRGGCYRHRTMAEAEGRENGRNYFCRSYQIFFDKCLDRLINAARILSR